jgi:uncharacterized protein (TIGR03663 family)
MRHPPAIPHAFWAMLAAGLALRLIALDARPLHHDEAVNWHFIGRWLAGDIDYDPARFHGPTLFALGALARAFGDHAEWSLRVPVAVVGALTPLLLLPLRRELGGRWLVLATALIAVSPTLVWVHRYAIHETLLVAAQLGFLVACWRALVDGSARALALAAVAAAFAMATKETAFVGLGIVLIALALLIVARALPAGAVVPAPRDLARHLLASARHLGGAAILFAALLAFAYSEGGTDWQALAELPGGLVAWIAIGAAGSGHGQPWHYFPLLVGRYEPALLVAAVFAAPALAARAALPWLFALVVAGTLTAYSIPPYKTPWLAANIVLPLALLAAVGLDRAWERRRTAGIAMAAIVLATSGVLAWRLNGPHRTDPAEPMVYVHTNERIHELVAAIEAAAARTAPQPVRIAVLSAEQWPLPFYLRGRDDVAWYTKREALPGVLPALLVLDTRAGTPADFPGHDPRGQWLVRPGQTWLLLAADREPVAGAEAAR